MNLPFESSGYSFSEEEIETLRKLGGTRYTINLQINSQSQNQMTLHLYDKALIQIIREEFRSNLLHLHIEKNHKYIVTYIVTASDYRDRQKAMQEVIAEFDDLSELDANAGHVIREYGQAATSKEYISDCFKPFSDAFAVRIMAELSRLEDIEKNNIQPQGLSMLGMQMKQGSHGGVKSGFKSTPQRTGKTHQQVFDLLLSLKRIDLERIYLKELGVLASNNSTDSELAMFIITSAGHKKARELYEMITRGF